MDISHEHGGSAASSQVMKDWSNPEHPPGVRPLLRLTWTFGLHLKLFLFSLQRSLGALMESVFSSLPGCPLAAQGIVWQPGPGSLLGGQWGGAVQVHGQFPDRHWPRRVAGCDRSQRDQEVGQGVGTHRLVTPHLPFHLPAPFPALSGQVGRGTWGSPLRHDGQIQGLSPQSVGNENQTQNELPGAEPFGAAKGCGC